MFLNIFKNKQLSFITVSIALIFLYIIFRGSQWMGSTHLHTVMEVAATLLALMIGISGLIRFYAKPNETLFLFIGAGFLGTGFLDGYHAIVTSEYFSVLYPSPPESLIPWSWIASRLYLSVFLFWAYIDTKTDNLNTSPKKIYIITAITTIVSFIFFAFVPLPAAYYSDLFFHRPEELLPALFFALALYGFYKKQDWEKSSFEYWLVMALIVSLISQVVFMSFSQRLFDYEFDMAHLLKKASYICVLTGIYISMLNSFKEELKISNINKEQKNEIDAIFRLSPIAMGYVDSNGMIYKMNQHLNNLMGYNETNVIDMNTWFTSAYPDESYREDVIKRWSKYVEEAKNHNGYIKSDLYNVTYADGTQHPTLIAGQLHNDGFIATFVDMTKEENEKNELRSLNKKLSLYKTELEIQKNRYVTIMQNSSDSIFIADAGGYVVEYSKKFKNTLGYSDKDMDNLHITDFENSHTKEIVNKNIKELLNSSQSMSFESEYKRKDGSVLYVYIRAVKMILNNIPYIYTSFNDITELVNAKQELNWYQNYDNLTSLPNKNLFNDRLQEAIKHSGRTKNKFAVLLLDIDHLKNINESFSHKAGDIVLKTFANWLKDTLREDDTVSRYEGNSFAILLNDIHDDLDPQRIIDSLRNITDNKKVQITDQNLSITFSAGIVIYPNDAKSKDILLRNLDAALYSAKEAGRNTYAYYKQELTEKAFEQVLMSNNLKDAIKNNDFVLYYQPQYNSLSETLIGLEALIRWKHETLGIITPNRFIPILESTNLMIDVGEWIIKTVFEQAVKWNQQNFEFGVISLNLSMTQLKSNNHLVQTITTLLDQTQCKPEWIGIEVTESMTMSNDLDAIEILKQLKELGFYISMDDFGTGYSSLSYLKKLPIDKLKIDKSFIDDIPHDEEGIVMVKTIISLAKNLKLGLIAEGVESIEQKEFLLENGCNEIQGYLYSKPLPVDDIADMFK